MLPKLDWQAALKAGLMIGGLFVLFPLGSPWASLGFGSAAVMSRAASDSGWMSVLGKIALHLGLAVAYTVAIAMVVKRFRSWRAMLAGAVVGLILYVLNLAFVSVLFPQFTGLEARVIFTHVLFGIFAAALYKGMTNEPPAPVPRLPRGVR